MSAALVTIQLGPRVTGETHELEGRYIVAYDPEYHCADGGGCASAGLYRVAPHAGLGQLRARGVEEAACTDSTGARADVSMATGDAGIGRDAVGRDVAIGVVGSDDVHGSVERGVGRRCA